MRILVVTPTFLPAWGGAERLLYEVFRRIAERHDVRLVAPESPAHAVNEQAAKLPASIPFEVQRYAPRCCGDRAPGRRFHRGFFPPFDLSAIPVVSRETASFQPDVICAFYAVPTGLGGAVAAWRHNIPMVLSFIGRDVPGPTTPPGWRFWDRLLVRAADETVYLNDFCRTAVLSHRARSGVLIPAGAQPWPEATPEQGRALRQKIADGSTVLFSLQRLSIYKGVDITIRSMAHLKEHNCVLYIAGGGPDRERLQELIHELALEEKVILLGYVPEEDLSAWWEGADIFVFHSYSETFGMVAAEAMRAGLPVVSVNSTSIPEVVDHGKTGLLVPPGNPAALANAIVQLIDNPSLRASYGAAGRAKAEREFSWDTIAKQYEEVFYRATRRND